MSEREEADETTKTDGVDIERVPILINEHTVALLTLYTKDYDKLDDVWAWDYCNAHETAQSASKQFLAALEDHWSPAFLMALRDEITTKLRKHDEECGTKFAEMIRP
jgi:hypothetical protein